jgi:acetyltransferase
LALPAPGADVEQVVKECYPLAEASNPFDPAGGSTTPDAIGKFLQVFADEQCYDSVLVAAPVFLPEFMAVSIKPLVEALADFHYRRVALSVWSAGEPTALTVDVARSSGRPVFDTPERAINAIRLYDTYGSRAARSPLQILATPVGNASTPTRTLTYWSSREKLKALGVPFNRAHLAHGLSDALTHSAAIGYPVTLKVSLANLTHKASGGGVLACVRSEAEARARFDGLAQLLEEFGSGAEDEGIVVEEYVGSVAAALVGGHRDPEFGPMLLFGLGGGLVEFYRDVTYCPCPLDWERLSEALARSAFGRYVQARELEGAIAELLVPLSEVFATDSSLVSFDVNPLLLQDSGSFVAVDARVEERA